MKCCGNCRSKEVCTSSERCLKQYVEDLFDVDELTTDIEEVADEELADHQQRIKYLSGKMLKKIVRA